MATQNKLDWHIICGSMEVEELVKYQMIKPWNPRNNRHSLFLTMKYPNYDFYKGGWGTEILYYDKETDPYKGRCGHMYLTYNRYKEISHWFLMNVFPA